MSNMYHDLGICLLSSFSIITVAWLVSPVVKLDGREYILIIRSKVSLLSKMSSLVIKTLNKALVIPAGIVTVYGPGP